MSKFNLDADSSRLAIKEWDGGGRGTALLHYNGFTGFGTWISEAVGRSASQHRHLLQETGEWEVTVSRSRTGSLFSY